MSTLIKLVATSFAFLIPSFNASFFRSESKLSSYEAAIQYCRAKSGYLASFHSEEDLHSLHQICKTCEDRMNFCFVGLDDRDGDGEYKFIDGTTFNYQNWAVGEPNGSTDDRWTCGMISGSIALPNCEYINDVGDGSCDFSRYALCETEIPEIPEQHLSNNNSTILIILTVICSLFMLFVCCIAMIICLQNVFSEMSNTLEVLASLTSYLEIFGLFMLLVEDCVAIIFEEADSNINATIVILVYSLLYNLVICCEINPKTFYLTRFLMIMFEIIQAILFVLLTGMSYRLSIVFVLILVTQILLFVLLSVHQYYFVLKNDSGTIHSYWTVGDAYVNTKWAGSIWTTFSIIFSAPLVFWMCNDGCFGIQIAVASQLWMFNISADICTSWINYHRYGVDINAFKFVTELIICIIGPPFAWFYISQQWMPDTNNVWSNQTSYGYLIFLIIYLCLWYLTYGIMVPIKYLCTPKVRENAQTKPVPTADEEAEGLEEWTEKMKQIQELKNKAQHVIDILDQKENKLMKELN